MRRLLLLVDSPDYVRQNCYQRQLLAVLSESYQVTMVSARQIRLFPFIFLSKYDNILSVLKLRTLDAILPSLTRLLRGAPIYIYEQDPWQSFMDNSPYKGAYERIHNALRVKLFLVTSRWWANFISARGFPTCFVRMGMLPQYCDVGPTWLDRPLRLAFQGTLHEHRRNFYERLNSMGYSVTVLDSGSYESYLNNLHRMRIYLHTEDAPWMVDGKLIPRNAIWIKDTEVAARGTFAIRDWDEEADAYDISELPTIFTFRNIEEIPEIIGQIEGMSENERNRRMLSSAATMLRRNDWATVVRAMDGME